MWHQPCRIRPTSSNVAQALDQPQSGMMARNELGLSAPTHTWIETLGGSEHCLDVPRAGYKGANVQKVLLLVAAVCSSCRVSWRRISRVAQASISLSTKTISTPSV